MKLRLIPDEFSILQVTSLEDIDLNQPFVFTAVTDEEISLMMRSIKKPAEMLSCDDGWVMFGIVGVLDFSLIGILAPIAQLLANHKIGIFVVSTFNTDYILVKKTHLEETISVLKDAGYEIEGEVSYG